ncbi:MAG TPA: hypothetical protein VF742_15145 [Terracidiphilus sp.]
MNSKFSAEGVEPLLNAEQTKTGRSGCCEVPGIESDAIVLNYATNGWTVVTEAYLHRGSASVSANVGERLLNDAVEGDGELGWEAVAERGAHGDAETSALRNAGSEKLDSSDKTEMIEHGRSQLVGEIADALIDAREINFDFAEAFLNRRREILYGVIEAHMGRDHELACVIMERVGNAAHLLLEGLVESAQNRVGFTDGTVGHFKRGHTLGEKFTGAGYGLGRQFRSEHGPRNFREGSVVEMDHIEDTVALGQAFAADLVAALQRFLSAETEVVTKRACVNAL